MNLSTGLLTVPGGITANLTGIASKATAANLTTTANAIAYYTNTTGTFGTKASANGALYATAANGALNWGTLPAAQGGTGKTSLKDAGNAILNALDTGSSTPVDADYYISQYVNGGTTTTTYHRRPVSALWTYIKGKADSTYLKLSGGTMSGSITFGDNNIGIQRVGRSMS